MSESFLQDLVNIILAAALINHVVLSQSLGVSAFFAYSSRLNQALEMALLTLPVFITATLVNLILDRIVLIPLQLEFLRLLVFISTTAALTCLVAEYIGKHFPPILRRNELALYLVGGNSAIIGLIFLANVRELPLSYALIYCIASGLGFVLFLVGFAALRERLDKIAVPSLFRGAPLALLSAGVLAMSLLAMRGLV